VQVLTPAGVVHVRLTAFRSIAAMPALLSRASAAPFTFTMRWSLPAPTRAPGPEVEGSSRKIHGSICMVDEPPRIRRTPSSVSYSSDMRRNTRADIRAGSSPGGLASTSATPHDTCALPAVADSAAPAAGAAPIASGAVSAAAASAAMIVRCVLMCGCPVGPFPRSWTFADSGAPVNTPAGGFHDTPATQRPGGSSRARWPQYASPGGVRRRGVPRHR